MRFPRMHRRRADIAERHVKAVEQADREVEISKERLAQGRRVQRELTEVATSNHYADLIRKAITGEELWT